MKPSGSESHDDPISPVCQPTMERLQLVLDGELEAVAIDTDSHPTVCAACRERVATARLMLSILATNEPVVVPEGMADRIVSAVREDRYSRIRRRSYAGAIGVLVTLAAAWLLWPGQPSSPVAVLPKPTLPLPVAREIAPEPRPVGANARPLRIGDELTKAGIALRETPKAITEPASSAPVAFVKLTNAITRPIAPDPEEREPARSALAELPDVALTGLEPLAGTAQKAFTRLLRDVGSVSVKPKS